MHHPIQNLLGLLAIAVATASQAEPAPAPTAPNSYSCFIEPSEVVDIGSPVAGIVAEVLYDRADQVNAGDIVVRLESVIEESNLRLAAAQARFVDEIREHEVHLEFAERRFRRAETMHKKKAITTEQRDQAEAEFRIAAKQLAKARHNHEIARLEYQRSLQLREQRNIQSPISGVVVDRLIAPGEFASDAALLRVAQIDPLKVEVVFPADTLGDIERGDRLAVRTQETAEQLEATVTVVDRVVDAASGTYRVTLNLPNPGQSIASGLKCDVDHPAIGASAAVAER